MVAFMDETEGIICGESVDNQRYVKVKIEARLQDLVVSLISLNW